MSLCQKVALDEEFTQLPDSLREKILDKDAVFSVQEARELVNFRRSMGDTLVPRESAPDTTIIPKDSLFGTHVNPLIVGTEVLGLNAFVWAWDHNHWAINFYGHPYQGSMFGEVLYRLSRASYNGSKVPWYRHLLAFALEPAGYAQRRVFGNRDFYTGWTPIELTVATGIGSRFGSDYRFGGEDADELDAE